MLLYVFGSWTFITKVEYFNNITKSEIPTIYSALQMTQENLTVSLSLYKNYLASEIVEYFTKKKKN